MPAGRRLRACFFHTAGSAALSVLAGGAAFRFPEDMGKMRGGDEPRRLAYLGNGQVGLLEQRFRLRAAELMMIAQRRHARMALEGAQQIAAVDIQRLRHLLQGKLFFAVGLHIGLRRLGQGFAAGVPLAKGRRCGDEVVQVHKREMGA